VDKTPLGAALNTSDDLVVRSDGTIYFTDPVVAHGPYLALPLGRYPLYRVKPGPDPRQIVSESTWALPNGVELSPDEKTLYMIDYLGGTVQQFSVAADGSLSAKPPLASGLSIPDSMCLDAAGNVYIGVNNGLLVLRPDGSVVTTIPVQSSQGTTNCTFGGPDGKTLYITAWTLLLKVDGMPIPGLDFVASQRRGCPAP
jgi:gluconolactonase